MRTIGGEDEDNVSKAAHECVGGHKVQVCMQPIPAHLVASTFQKFVQVSGG